MKRLLLVEDTAKDSLNAATIAESVGIDKVEAYNTVTGAMLYLDKGLSGDGPLPDAIVLDLDLGTESGYELLRRWHSTAALSRIPVMVWSVVEQQREVCELFRVNSFVSKWEGPRAFRQALAQMVTPTHAG